MAKDFLRLQATQALSENTHGDRKEIIGATHAVPEKQKYLAVPDAEIKAAKCSGRRNSIVA